MNRNLVGSIYGRSSIRIAHFVLPAKYKYSLCLLVSEENIFYLQPIRNEVAHGDHVFFPIEMKWAKMLSIKCCFIWPNGFGGDFFLIDQPQKRLCTQCNMSCRSYNWYVRHRQFLFVIGQLNKSSLKPFGQINWTLFGKSYGRFCIKFPQSKMTGERHMLSLGRLWNINSLTNNLCGKVNI
jgi:hypothetical protein